MQAPHRTRPKTDNDAASFPVNEDPKRLDNALLKMLGPGADKLPEGVKWLSVTHKSFDHGRRGFNDRLAHLGESHPFMHTIPKSINYAQLSATLLPSIQVSS